MTRDASHPVALILSALAEAGDKRPDVVLVGADKALLCDEIMRRDPHLRAIVADVVAGDVLPMPLVEHLRGVTLTDKLVPYPGTYMRPTSFLGAPLETRNQRKRRRRRAFR